MLEGGRGARVLWNQFVPAGVALVSLLARLLAATPAQFIDIAGVAGLNDVFYCGGNATKKHIIEIAGSAPVA